MFNGGHMEADYPTAKELCALLGQRWAICRNTEKNRARYVRCITKKQYRAACVEALELRAYPNTTWTERAVFYGRVA